VILVVLRLQVRPVVGEISLVRVTVPVNPNSDATLMVTDPFPSAAEFAIGTVVGLAAIVKSCIE
jgi:hypothetical protein